MDGRDYLMCRANSHVGAVAPLRLRAEVPHTDEDIRLRSGNRGARDGPLQHVPLNGPLRSRLLVLRHSTTRREETTLFSRHSDRGRRRWLPAAARDPVPPSALSIADVHLTQQTAPSPRSIARHFRLLPRAPPGVRSLAPSDAQRLTVSPSLRRPSDDAVSALQ
jgi:hypothetical protein